MLACGRVREHVCLRVTRYSVEYALITHNREYPRLLIYGTRCAHGGVNQTADCPRLKRLCRICAHRASPDDCVVQIHCIAPLASRVMSPMRCYCSAMISRYL